MLSNLQAAHRVQRNRVLMRLMVLGAFSRRTRHPDNPQRGVVLMHLMALGPF